MNKVAWIATLVCCASALFAWWLWLENHRYSLVGNAQVAGTAYKIDHRTEQVWSVTPGGGTPIISAETRVQLETPEEKAITLARSSFVLTPLTQAKQLVRDTLSKESGPIRIEGWKSERIDPDTFLVSFIYERDGEGRRGWVFEVLLSEEVVRAVLYPASDPALADGGRSKPQLLWLESDLSKRYEAQTKGLLGRP
jgi:hypothetical protein